MQKNRSKQLIGLTGGIASGKSTVAKLFALLGISIYNSDQRAKQIIIENSEVRAAIIEAFGEESYTNEGAYNTKHISAIVFQNKERLAQLNAIVHPAVFADQAKWVDHINSPYGIIESALLFETGKQDQFDQIIVVAADDELRVQRVISRDNRSEEEAWTRLKSQISQQEKVDLSHFVIWNNGTESLIEQVMSIHEKLIE